MATIISGELTRQELEVIIRDNAGWRFDPTLAKVQLYIEACEAWLIAPISELEESGIRGRMEPRVVQERLQKAINWYETRAMLAQRPRCTYPSMTNFREH